MKVRHINFDFSQVRPHWAPNKEFVQMFNASSTVPAHIEPYLVKVMVKAKAALGPKHEKLHRDIDIFIKQEIQHCKQHLAFNKRLHESGYEGMKVFEKEYADDYVRFLETKSLRFNCAYSEGFEAFSSFAVIAFFEAFDPYLEGADPVTVDLWKWHLAEEYEHREVAHDVYQTLFGHIPIFSYLYRIYGLFYAALHIGRHTKRVSEYLLAKDRENMSPEEAAERAKAPVPKTPAAMSMNNLGLLFSILSPFYDPKKRRKPKGWDEFLAHIETAYAST